MDKNNEVKKEKKEEKDYITLRNEKRAKNLAARKKKERKAL